MSNNNLKNDLCSNNLGETEVHRSFDGSIDFRYYQRKAHCLRSEKAWDIFRVMGQLLPFNRDRDESLHLHKSGCTMT